MSQILQLLLEKITKNRRLIDEWFDNKFLENKPIFYNSVDLRHSGFKIAPVDNNCFPAGFNNLNKESRANAQKIFQKFLKNQYPNVKKIIIIPESHTRNDRYLQNVLALKSIVEHEDIEVVIGTIMEDINDKIDIELKDNIITLHKVFKDSNNVTTKSGFVADLIISNNDFTKEPEDIFNNINCDIIPPSNLGWYNRTKSQHFDCYQKLANELAKLIDIDPWLISTIHSDCKNVDFKNRQNIDNLANITDNVISKISDKYQQYNIDLNPYCYVKADSGTYGMAMMTVNSGEDILAINKKQRNKMNMIKGSIINNKVIIQEGIMTSDQIANSTAEPMVYMINSQVIGNLFRINNSRDKNISLNAANMEFKDIKSIDNKELDVGLDQANAVIIYNIIGRLSALAAANEIKNK